MSEIRTISMPKWGMEMSEGTVSEWYLQIGDQINTGDDLVDVETSKIINTVTSPATGTLRAILANTGETHAVGAPLAVIAAGDVAQAEIDAFIQQLGNSSDQAASTETDSSDSAATENTAGAENQAPQNINEVSQQEGQAATGQGLQALQSDADDSQINASPVARRLAKDYGVNLSTIEGTGRHGRVSKRDLEAAILAAGGQLISRQQERSQPPVLLDDSHIKATPVARRLAAQLQINLHECRASGDRGRVCKADVEAVAALRSGAPRLTADSQAPCSAPVGTAAFQEQTMSGMRKTIASRLQSSKQTAPHFRVQTDVCIDALLAARKQINEATAAAKISVNDFIVKACAAALLEVPKVNVQFDGETLRYFSQADIAVAVAIDEGLITPIVTAVEGKGLVTISNELRDLITRAKINRLQPEEFQGGSFCVSNLGMFGIKQFDAIINPPQGAILAVGAGEQRPHVVNGKLEVATLMSLTLSCDHRVIDGAIAAEFMSVLKRYLEQPMMMLS